MSTPNWRGEEEDDEGDGYQFGESLPGLGSGQGGYYREDDDAAGMRRGVQDVIASPLIHPQGGRSHSAARRKPLREQPPQSGKAMLAPEGLVSTSAKVPRP
jgi:hypothetical protein